MIKLGKDALNGASTISKKCIGCNKCMKNCPMLHQYCETPKTLFQTISQQGAVDRKLAFSCTGCDYCQHVCPKGLDIGSFCYDVKRQCVKESAVVNKAGQLSVVNFHRASTHPVFTYLDKKIKKGDTDIVFMPGCSLASSNPKLIRRIVQRMNRVEPVGLFIDCCGNPIYGIGDQERFDQNVQRISKLFKTYGIRKVITACGNCLKMFSASYPVEVQDLWQYMDQHSEVFILKGQHLKHHKEIVIHDPCSFRKNSLAHESVRSLMKKMGMTIKEFNDNRDLTPCCGAGGMMEIMVPEQAAHGQKSRASMAEGHEIISYCQSCIDGFRQVGHEGRHLLDIMFEEVADKPQQQTTLRRWWNRWLVSNIVK